MRHEATGEATFIGQYVPVDPFMAKLKNVEPETRAMALCALGYLLPRPSAPGDEKWYQEYALPIVQATHDPVAAVRAEAAVTVGRRRLPGTRPRLAEMLGDSEADVRESVANGRRWPRDPGSLGTLQQAIGGETSRPARSMMIRALRQIEETQGQGR